MKKAAIVKVYGKVQNVGFRHHTKKTADQHQISGYVKNLPDGSVYIEAEGEEERLDHFILWCHKGPIWSNVEHLAVQDMPVGGYEGFVIR